MNPERFKNQNGRASEAQVADIITHYIKPGYKIQCCKTPVTDHGHLEILKIIPEDDSGIAFSGRWDHRQDKLKFDILRANGTETRRFNNGEQGYYGHHALKTCAQNERGFLISICVASSVYFIGIALFTLTFNMALGQQFGVGGRADS
jgi:hypothetical protein